MQPTGAVWTTLIGDHLGIIPGKFGQYPMSDFSGELFKEIVDARTGGRTHGQWTTDNGPSQQLTWAQSALCAQVG